MKKRPASHHDQDIHENRLADETSPYLLQHAANPVHWQPWDESALQAARDADKPILLSIGYSACHWCHVMAHESFEDEETAALMNRLYVNVKVDREERPDLDRIYQLTHQMLTGRPGGWPLTVILTPRGHAPIFAGTYFPPQPRHGMPSFRYVLEQVESHYRQHRDQMDEHDAAVREQLERISSAPRTSSNAADVGEDRFEQFLGIFDNTHGGFGQAPKFPHAVALDALLDAIADRLVNNPEALAGLLRLTLDEMAFRGMFDHVGGGFFRYSVDERWEIPHFEKMLYDNAQLMPLYARAGVFFDRDDYKEVAVRTADWMLREMRLDEGGFASSLDADSDGGEGRFYLFTRAEILDPLDEESKTLVKHLFGLDKGPNFEGRYHLARSTELETAAEKTSVPIDRARSLLSRTQGVLRDIRDRRNRPDRDEKCLTSWNALTIKALAQTGRLLSAGELVEAAERCLAFLNDRHLQGGRLLAVSRDGRARFSAYLDDHVFLADAALELLRNRWDDNWFELATNLMDHVLERFRGPQGALYFTADDHETLLNRPVSGADDSLPSGNGVACRVLLELGHLRSAPRFIEAAHAILDFFRHEIATSPVAHGALLTAMNAVERPRAQVILRGGDHTVAEWSSRLRQAFALRIDVYAIGSAAADGVPHGRDQAPEAASAWICAGHRCLPRIDDIDEIFAMVDAIESEYTSRTETQGASQ